MRRKVWQHLLWQINKGSTEKQMWFLMHCFYALYCAILHMYVLFLKPLFNVLWIIFHNIFSGVCCIEFWNRSFHVNAISARAKTIKEDCYSIFICNNISGSMLLLWDLQRAHMETMATKRENNPPLFFMYAHVKAVRKGKCKVPKTLHETGGTSVVEIWQITDCTTSSVFLYYLFNLHGGSKVVQKSSFSFVVAMWQQSNRNPPACKKNALSHSECL